MEPPLTPKPTISTPLTSDASGQSSQFLGVLYLALTGLIDSALPAAGPWAVAEKALSYLVKLGPIIWWAMPVPALTPPSPAGAPRVTVDSIMLGIVRPGKKAWKAGKPVSKLTKLTDLNQTVD
ncbi:hypothetical protein DSO57_1012989 [Entomophthora muscae]|uniref:Uncharacterized protein n=1 Tax=Entomophthora muscae TaxID=34485 RepID=A0ACC2UFC3_9FUNG|nr:hypothetical protein DSO57_1012989 [Entomophthora muscae]